MALLRTSPVARIGLGVAAVLALPLVGMLLTDGVDWTLADFVLAGAFLALIGIAVELVVRRAGTVATAAGIGVVGVLAAAWGSEDDAPGLVLLGLVLIACACALGLRLVRRPR